MHNPEQYFHAELETMPRAALEAGINIAYLYSFLIHEKGILIFRTDDVEKTRQVITDNHLHYIAEEALGEIGNN